MPKNSSQKEQYRFVVTYGAMNPGDYWSNLGVVIAKGCKPGRCSPAMAENAFAGSRCRVKISLDPNASGDASQSDSLFDAADKCIEGTADIKRYSANAHNISIKLTFNNEAVEPVALLEFRKGNGYMEVERQIDLPAKSQKGKAFKPGDDDADLFKE
jgi:hypothetical protein